MEKINRFTRRPFLPEEVYSFSVVLCDNEIDRDNECFETAALHRMAELFVGKTGICDHEARAQNQQARIYEAWVEEEPKRATADGRPYAALWAKAYMVRTETNQDLILEIEAGIKKEVSVCCTVEKAVCAVCGADRKKEGCTHLPGHWYNGKRCFTVLQQPSDAYEWSFVAVPTQREAGVVKQKTWGRGEKKVEDILKKLSRGEALTVEQGEHLAKKIKAMEEESKAYRRHVKAGVLEKAFGAQAEEKTELSYLLDRLETREMELMGRLLEKAAGQQLREPQAAGGKERLEYSSALTAADALAGKEEKVKPFFI